MGFRPEVRYARSDGFNIAYTRWGEGENVVVYTPPWVSNVDLFWDLEEYARVGRYAGRYHQVITCDKRGVGLSDRSNTPPTLDDRVADTLAVMDAEGLASATVVGMSEGGAIAIALAARHPERVDRLAVVGSALPGVPFSDLAPHVRPGDPRVDGVAPLRDVLEHWGTPRSRGVHHFMPSGRGDARIEQFMQRFERHSASPGSLAAQLASAVSADVSGDVDRVRCPTFIGHCSGDGVIPVATSRYLASRWPEAIVRLWDDPNHLWYVSPKWRDIQGDLIEFIDGVRPARERTSTFGVILFTDIVDSTKRTRELGDAAWARLLRAHDAAADRILGRHGGRRVKSTGDGMLAIFTDPEQAVRAGHRLRDELAGIGVEIRGGLHAGQVELQDDGDLTGIAVNIAARVESVAPRGAICTSATLHDLLLGSRVAFESLGERDLKGVGHPVEVFVTRVDD